MTQPPVDLLAGATLSAVIVPVPPAEPLVAEHRLHLDRAAAWGVPAHVTVLFPFVPPADLSGQTLATLTAAVSAVPRFDCVFADVGWFDEDVVWLRPDPQAAESFAALTSAVWEAFPQFPPYGGAHPDVVPHLTVGESGQAELTQLRRAATEVADGLPVSFSVHEATLIAGREAPESWQVLRRLPLGAGDPMR